MALPLTALTSLFFNNVQKDKLHGLEIWTDKSVSPDQSAGPFAADRLQPTIVRVQVVPQNIQFVQKARISEQVIKDGRAFFFWRKDRRSNHLDLLELQLTGITRSLAKEPPVRSGFDLLKDAALETLKQVDLDKFEIGNIFGSPPQEDKITQKQREWLKFWSITRQPFVTSDGINEHHIRLETPALPLAGGVTFTGHFTGPVQFSEVADNPFLVQWQLGLIVHRTTPSLDVMFQKAGVNVFTEDPPPPRATPPTTVQPVATPNPPATSGPAADPGGKPVGGGSPPAIDKDGNPLFSGVGLDVFGNPL